MPRDGRSRCTVYASRGRWSAPSSPRSKWRGARSPSPCWILRRSRSGIVRFEPRRCDGERSRNFCSERISNNKQYRKRRKRTMDNPAIDRLSSGARALPRWGQLTLLGGVALLALAAAVLVPYTVIQPYVVPRVLVPQPLKLGTIRLTAEQWVNIKT